MLTPFGLHPVTTAHLAVPACYVATSVACYCQRRGRLHKLGAAEVWRRHLDFEPGWPPGLRGIISFTAAVSVWIAVFSPIYPILEILLRPFRLAAFFYYYPNANGFGLLVERIADKKCDREQMLRLDWHRFTVNVGKPGKPYEYGGRSRHPPSVVLNLPHIDLPFRGVRHWPWRQYPHIVLRPELARAAALDASARKKRHRATRPDDQEG